MNRRPCLHKSRGSYPMADLTAEQFEQVPEFLHGDYEKVEVEGAEVYRHVGDIKTAKLKNSLDELDKKHKAETGELSERLTKFESEQQEKIEAAKKEALEKAKTSGDVEAIEKRYQEQMADVLAFSSASFLAASIFS